MAYIVEARESTTASGGYAMEPCIPEGVLSLASARADSTLAAEQYNRRYGRAADGIFTRYDGTPMLNALTEHLKFLQGVLPARVVEVGAGFGVQTRELVSRVPYADIFALDTSPLAVDHIRAQLPSWKTRFARGSRILPQVANIFDWFGQQEAGSVHGVHANSFGHFLPEATEAVFLRLALAAQPEGGLFAISQKDTNDGLLTEPTTRLISGESDWVRAIPADGIERRFLRNVDVLAQRLLRAGYSRIVGTYGWLVPGYDNPKRPDLKASFVGVLAQK